MTFSKQVHKSFRKSFSLFSPYTMIFGLIVILVLILGYAFPISYIATIPLIIIPFMFGYQISLVQAELTKKVDLKTIFVGFKIYYSPRGFGAYSSLKGLLKAFIAFIIVFAIAITISLSISVGLDVSLRSLIAKITSSTSLKEYSSLLNELINNKTFIWCNNLSIVIALFPALYMFFHNTFVYSLKTLMILTTGSNPIPMKAMGDLYKTAFPYIRSDFYSDYYSIIWINIILFIVGYSAGSTIGMIFLQEAYAFRIATIGVATAFILNLLLIPLIFIMLDKVFLKNKQKILSASVIKIIKESEAALKNKALSNEERKDIESLKNEYQKVLDDLNKKDKKKE